MKLPEGIDSRVESALKEAINNYVPEGVALEDTAERESFLIGQLATLICLDKKLYRGMIEKGIVLLATATRLEQLPNGMKFAFIMYQLEQDLKSVALGDESNGEKKPINNVVRDAIQIMKQKAEMLSELDFCTPLLLKDLLSSAFSNFIDSIDGTYLPVNRYGEIYRKLVDEVLFPLLLEKWGLLDDGSKIFFKFYSQDHE